MTKKKNEIEVKPQKPIFPIAPTNTVELNIQLPTNKMVKKEK